VSGGRAPGSAGSLWGTPGRGGRALATPETTQGVPGRGEGRPQGIRLVSKTVGATPGGIPSPPLSRPVGSASAPSCTGSRVACRNRPRSSAPALALRGARRPGQRLGKGKGPRKMAQGSEALSEARHKSGVDALSVEKSTHRIVRGSTATVLAGPSTGYRIFETL
jgi:hypothetical protein